MTETFDPPPIATATLDTTASAAAGRPPYLASESMDPRWRIVLPALQPSGVAIGVSDGAVRFDLTQSIDDQTDVRLTTGHATLDEPVIQGPFRLSDSSLLWRNVELPTDWGEAGAAVARVTLRGDDGTLSPPTLDVSFSDGLITVSRTEADATTTVDYQAPLEPAAREPAARADLGQFHWLRIEFSGDQYTIYGSIDGELWAVLVRQTMSPEMLTSFLGTTLEFSMTASGTTATGSWIVGSINTAPAATNFAGVYLQSEDQGGFSYNTGVWNQFGYPLDGIRSDYVQNPDDDQWYDPGGNVHYRWVTALAYARDDPNTLYAVAVDTVFLFISHDGGLTWTQKRLPFAELDPPDPAKPNGAAGDVFDIASARRGDIEALHKRVTSATAGIWHSSDEGDTWVRIAEFTPASTEFPINVYYPEGVLDAGGMRVSANKVWWAQQVGYTLEPPEPPPAMPRLRQVWAGSLDWQVVMEDPAAAQPVLEIPALDISQFEVQLSATTALGTPAEPFLGTAAFMIVSGSAPGIWNDDLRTGGTTESDINEMLSTARAGQAARSPVPTTASPRLGTPVGEWWWSSDLTQPPAPGEVRANGGPAWETASTLYVSIFDSSGNDQTEALNSFAAGAHGVTMLGAEPDGATQADYQVTGTPIPHPDPSIYDPGPAATVQGASRNLLHRGSGGPTYRIEPGYALVTAEDGVERAMHLETGRLVDLSRLELPSQQQTIGWVTAAFATAPTGKPFVYMSCDFEVPPDPSEIGTVGTGGIQLVYLFPGLQTSDRILQPVLTFGPAGDSAGYSGWAVHGEWASGGSTPTHTVTRHTVVDPGERLTGVVRAIRFPSDANPTWDYECYFEGFPDSRLFVPGVTNAIVSGVVAIEAYNNRTGDSILTVCQRYPNTDFTAFDNITFHTGDTYDNQIYYAPDVWQLENFFQVCGAHALMTSASRAQLWYRSGTPGRVKPLPAQTRWRATPAPSVPAAPPPGTTATDSGDLLGGATKLVISGLDTVGEAASDVVDLVGSILPGDHIKTSSNPWTVYDVTGDVVEGPGPSYIVPVTYLGGSAETPPDGADLTLELIPSTSALYFEIPVQYQTAPTEIAVPPAAHDDIAISLLSDVEFGPGGAPNVVLWENGVQTVWQNFDGIDGIYDKAGYASAISPTRPVRGGWTFGGMELLWQAGSVSDGEIDAYWNTVDDHYGDPWVLAQTIWPGDPLQTMWADAAAIAGFPPLGGGRFLNSSVRPITVDWHEPEPVNDRAGILFDGRGLTYGPWPLDYMNTVETGHPECSSSAFAMYCLGPVPEGGKLHVVIADDVLKPFKRGDKKAHSQFKAHLSMNGTLNVVVFDVEPDDLPLWLEMNRITGTEPYQVWNWPLDPRTDGRRDSIREAGVGGNGFAAWAVVAGEEGYLVLDSKAIGPIGLEKELQYLKFEHPTWIFQTSAPSVEPGEDGGGFVPAAIPLHPWHPWYGGTDDVYAGGILVATVAVFGDAEIPTPDGWTLVEDTDVASAAATGALGGQIHLVTSPDDDPSVHQAPSGIWTLLETGQWVLGKENLVMPGERHRLPVREHSLKGATYDLASMRCATFTRPMVWNDDGTGPGTGSSAPLTFPALDISLPYHVVVTIAGAYYLGKTGGASPSEINGVTWEIRRANLDGSQTETMAVLDLPKDQGISLPHTFQVRPFNDDVCLVSTHNYNVAYRVQAGQGATPVWSQTAPGEARVWDMIALDDNVLLAAASAYPTDPLVLNVVITTGSTWATATFGSSVPTWSSFLWYNAPGGDQVDDQAQGYQMTHTLTTLSAPGGLPLVPNTEYRYILQVFAEVTGSGSLQGTFTTQA